MREINQLNYMGGKIEGISIFCLLGLLIGISPNCVPFIHEYELYNDTLILFLNHLSHPKKECKMYVTNVNFYS